MTLSVIAVLFSLIAFIIQLVLFCRTIALSRRMEERCKADLDYMTAEKASCEVRNDHR